jgi:hypothetical protein
MTKFYADGRPADEGGRPVRYDAGGRAHVVGGDGGSMPQPVAKAAERIAADEDAQVTIIALQAALKVLRDVLGSAPKSMQGYELLHLLSTFADAVLHATEAPDEA